MGSTSKEIGTLQLWRLVKTEHVATAFDGEGAYRFGGRWNSRGQRVVYASSTLSLALLEILVHIDATGPMPAMSAIPIEVPADAIYSEEFSKLNQVTGGLPWSLGQTRSWGDDWNQSRKAIAMQVPSAIVPLESNYLLNPSHPSFQDLKIGDPHRFELDARL